MIQEQDISTLQHLGSNIRRLRKQQGLTQEQLSELSGLHRTYIGGVERGERNISFLALVCIARALHAPVAKLVEGIE